MTEASSVGEEQPVAAQASATTASLIALSAEAADLASAIMRQLCDLTRFGASMCGDSEHHAGILWLGHFAHGGYMRFVATLDEIYRRNHRRQQGMVGLAALAGLAIALGADNERAMFFTDAMPTAFAAVPLPPVTETGDAQPLPFVRLGGLRRLPAVGRVLPAGIPVATPVGPSGASEPPSAGVVAEQPFATALASLGPGPAVPGFNGPSVGSPFGPGVSASPVGFALAEPPVVTPTPTPTETAPTPTPTPTTSPTPTPTSTPTSGPETPTPTPTPTPTSTPPGPQPTVTPTATPTPVPAVPEPTTWLLMILGFFACGVALRAKRQQLVEGQALPIDLDPVDLRKRALPQ